MPSLSESAATTWRQRLHTVLNISLGFLLLMNSDWVISAGRGPAVSLFPTSVRENLKFTQEAAQSMETNLQDVVTDLEAQMQSYKASKCEGGDSDPGCRQIRANISVTFKSMLTQLDESLPEIERAVKQTNVGLGARLKNEVGRKMTPRDLQDKLLSSSLKSTPDKGTSRRRSRMSQNFKRYYDLVRTNSSQDLSTLAAEIYLDTEDSLRFIELTRAEIDTSLVTIEMDQFYGDITPEMIGALNGVKGLLFGETIEDGVIEDAPLPAAETQFKSPWEL